MCRLRQIRTVYKRCGHARTHPDVTIHCDSAKCIFSAYHPRGCTGEACKRSCWHYRQAPEQFTEHVDAQCPGCQRG